MWEGDCVDLQVKMASDDDIPFLAACGHTEDDKEIQDSISRKTDRFKKQWRDGLISLVGFFRGERAGFLNMFPMVALPFRYMGLSGERSWQSPYGKGSRSRTVIWEERPRGLQRIRI